MEHNNENEFLKIKENTSTILTGEALDAKKQQYLLLKLRGDMLKMVKEIDRALAEQEEKTSEMKK